MSPTIRIIFKAMIFVALTFSGAIKAQEFAKIFNTNITNQAVNSLYSDIHKAYFIVGYERTGTLTPIVTKTDISGNILWVRRYESGNYFQDISELISPDGKSSHIIIGGLPDGTYNSVRVIKLNPNSGTVVWSKSYTTNSSFDYGHMIVADNNIVLGATTSKGFGFAALDSNGNTLWSNTYLIYNKGGTINGWLGFNTQAGIACTFRSSPNNGIFCINKDGSFRFALTSSKPYYFRNISTNGDGFVTTAVLDWNDRVDDHMLLRFSSSGNMTWAKYLKSTTTLTGSFVPGEHSAVSTNNGEVYYVTRSGFSGRAAYNFIHFANNGNLISAKESLVDSLIINHIANLSQGKIGIMGASTKKSGCIQGTNINSLYSVFTTISNLCDLSTFNTLSVTNDNVVMTNVTGPNTTVTPITLNVSTRTNSSSLANYNQVNYCNDPKLVNLGPDISTCLTGNITLNAGTGFKTYQWSNGGSTPQISVGSSGTYWVKVTDDCNNTSSDTVVIKIGTPSSKNQSFAICPGDSVKVGTKTYKTVGIYTDTLKNAAGCDSILSTNITQSTNCAGNISGIINKYSPVTALTCDKITVENGSLFSVGNRVLIIQMKGAKVDTSNTANFGAIIDYKSAGNYEFNTIETITGNTISLKYSLKNTYEITGNVQLVYVPVYTDITVSGKLLGSPWDGKKGGIIALEASGTITMNADIDASGIGFRGGIVRVDPLPLKFCAPDVIFGEYSKNEGGQKGEGIAVWDSLRLTHKGAWANGGGGGNDANAGGGGGANVGKGGRGGKLYYEPNNQPNCQGGHGIGGKSILLNTAGLKIFLGGGGGAGHDNENAGSSGAKGGGIIIINANNINGNNFQINSNGSNALNAANDGAGGGGGGGVIAITAKNINACKLIANGGNGGNNTWVTFNQCHGTGGGGGGGVIYYSGNLNTSSISINPGIAGRLAFTNPPTPCTNINFEAEPGLLGTSINNYQIPYSDKINKIDSSKVNVALCNNQNYTLPDGTITTQSGTYKTLLKNIAGCDSLLITTKISFTNQILISLKPIICLGGSFKVGPKTYTIAGTYLDTLKSISNCDSIIQTDLTVKSPTTLSLTPTICKGTVFTVGNNQYSSTGNYIDTLQSVAGCDSIIQIQLTVKDILTSAYEDSICAGEFYVFNGKTFNQAGNYTETFTSSLGCDSIVTLTLKVLFNPAVDATANPYLVFAGANVQLFATPDSSAYQYSWTPTTGLSNPNISSPIATPETSTIYTVEIIYENGCTSSDTVGINVFNPCNLQIPNAYTPNGDGLNDCFRMLGYNEFDNYSCMIFNRWGEKVFESNSPDYCWDGKFKNEPAPMDSYIYVILFECSGELRKVKGVVTLIR